MANFDRDYDAMVVAVWETWTGNGRGLDADDIAQTTKSVQDAVNNAWLDGASIDAWRAFALKLLGHVSAEDREGARWARANLVLARSDAGDGGWSLHAPGSTDRQIAEGEARVLASGEAEMGADGEWSAPTDADYLAACEAEGDDLLADPLGDWHGTNA
jgi:hypothetical protein